MKKYQRGNGEILVVGIIFIAMLSVTFLFGHLLDKNSCYKKAGMMGLKADHSAIAGCMVQVGDRYAPIGYIRIVDSKVIIQGDGDE